MAPTRRITVKVHEQLWDSFTKQADALFLKRDAFLNDVIRLEIPYLEKELQGKRSSPVARRYIANEFKKLRPIPVNIVLDEAVAMALDNVVKESNLFRDGFINRLIMWLRSRESLLNLCGIPINTNELKELESMPVSPLKAMEVVRDNPFYYIRNTLDEEGKGKGLYTVFLSKNLIGLSCYLDDENVPGTEAYKAPIEVEL